jgi:hypothetical protein
MSLSIPFLTTPEIKLQFGSYTEEAIRLLTETYPILENRIGSYYFKIDLELFSDPIELFEVDQEMVNHEIELYPIFCDTTVDPDILANLMDLMEEKVGYSGVNNSGYLCIHFSDLRKWYGPAFDRDMKEKYPSYPSFKEWVEHVEYENMVLGNDEEKE